MSTTGGITSAGRLIRSLKYRSCPFGFAWVPLGCLWPPWFDLGLPLTSFGVPLGAAGSPLVVLWPSFWVSLTALGHLQDPFVLPWVALERFLDFDKLGHHFWRKCTKLIVNNRIIEPPGILKESQIKWIKWIKRKCSQPGQVRPWVLHAPRARMTGVSTSSLKQANNGRELSSVLHSMCLHSIGRTAR